MSNIAEIGGANVERKIGKGECSRCYYRDRYSNRQVYWLQGQMLSMNIAVVNMPSEAEREERRALHDKLDEMAAGSRTHRLRASSTHAHAGRRNFGLDDSQAQDQQPFVNVAILDPLEVDGKGSAISQCRCFAPSCAMKS